MTRPRIGEPLTWHLADADVSGTVTRVARTGTLCWFTTREGRQHRAINTLDGAWREDANCWPVTLGVARDGPRPEPRFETELDRHLFEVTRLEPWLLKRRWYPMSYLLISGIKTRAEALADELSRLPGVVAAEKAAHLRRLLRDFHLLKERTP